LPAPDGPVRNWNECGSMRNDRSRRTSGPRPYRKPTFSNRTTPLSDKFPLRPVGLPWLTKAAGGRPLKAVWGLRTRQELHFLQDYRRAAIAAEAPKPPCGTNRQGGMVSGPLTDGC